MLLHLLRDQNDGHRDNFASSVRHSRGLPSLRFTNGARTFLRPLSRQAAIGTKSTAVDQYNPSDPVGERVMSPRFFFAAFSVALGLAIISAVATTVKARAEHSDQRADYKGRLI